MKKNEPSKAMQEFMSSNKMTDIVESALRDSISNLTENYIVKYVDDNIKSGFRTLVAKALGFEDRYGNWTVDHTNGRKSELSTMLASKVAIGVDAILNKCISAIDGFELSQEQLDAIKKDYKDCIFSEIRQRTRAQADAVAKDFISNHMDKLLYMESDADTATIRALTKAMDEAADPNVKSLIAENIKVIQKQFIEKLKDEV